MTRSDKLTFVLCSVVLFIVLGGKSLVDETMTLNYLGRDSEEYLGIAKAMASFSFFKVNSASPIPLAEILRPPGYPLLLTPVILFFPTDQITGVFVLHFLLAVAMLAYVMKAFRGYVPTFVSGVLIIILSAFMGPYFRALLSEWPAFTLNFMLIGATLTYGTSPTKLRLFTAWGLYVLLVLVRPAMIPMVTLPLGSMIMAGSWKSRDYLLVTAVAFVPLLGLCLFNYAKLGTLRLTPLGDYNVFGITSLLGNAEIRESDPKDYRDFLTHVNQRSLKLTSELLDTTPQLENRLLLDRFIFNQHLAVGFISERGWTWVKFAELIRVFNDRVMRSYPGSYIHFVFCQLIVLIYSLPLVFVLGLTIIKFLRSSEYLALARLGILMLLSHVACTVALASVIAIQARYVLLNIYPLIFIGGIMIWVLCLEKSRSCS